VARERGEKSKNRNEKSQRTHFQGPAVEGERKVNGFERKQSEDLDGYLKQCTILYKWYSLRLYQASQSPALELFKIKSPFAVTAIIKRDFRPAELARKPSHNLSNIYEKSFKIVLTKSIKISPRRKVSNGSSFF